MIFSFNSRRALYFFTAFYKSHRIQVSKRRQTAFPDHRCWNTQIICSVPYMKFYRPDWQVILQFFKYFRGYGYQR